MATIGLKTVGRKLSSSCIMARVTTHPGEVLREEFMKPLGISDRALAAALGVSRYRVAAVRRERRPVDADTALRLSRYFGTSAEFWVNMQTAHDLTKTRVDSGTSINDDVRPCTLL